MSSNDKNFSHGFEGLEVRLRKPTYTLEELASKITPENLIIVATPQEQPMPLPTIAF